MWFGADRLLTLTYRENMRDVKQGWLDFQRFVRSMRKVFGRWPYVAVMEFQARGAVHFHVAQKGHIDVRIVRKLWRRVVGEGNIDITTPRRVKHDQKCPRVRIAGYLTKYMAKSFDYVPLETNRYRTSKGITLLDCRCQPTYLASER